MILNTDTSNIKLDEKQKVEKWRAPMGNSTWSPGGSNEPLELAQKKKNLYILVFFFSFFVCFGSLK